jgi:outer membrane murein-binding lipoprotein Lpp
MQKTRAEGANRVQVAVRIRPTNRGDGNDERIVVHSEGRRVLVDDVNGRRSRSFEYDHVFVGGQEEVYANIGDPMLVEAYKGFNVCLFAYGQTGSGKTYSIAGNVESEDTHGVLPRFVKEMFRVAQQRVEEDPEVTIKISMSMIELYMEKVRDLLVPRVKGQEPESLEIHEDQNRKVYVKNASVHSVLSYERVMELLALGNSNRQTAETKMNEMSSRSHSVVQFTISQMFDSLERRDIESAVSLVDLAGSERQGKTEASGQQFEEAKKINQSLLMLGRALNSFSDSRGETFVSLRDSKLTRLLSESFGGNSKTWMLATVSPAQYNAVETISTLEYAQNALCITNKAEVNRLERNLEFSELKSVVQELEKKIEARRGDVDAAQTRCDSMRRRVAALRDQLTGRVSADNNGEALRLAASEQDVLRRRLRDLRRRRHTDGQDASVAYCGECRASLVPLLDQSAPRCEFQLRFSSGSKDVGGPQLRVEVEMKVGCDATLLPSEWCEKSKEIAVIHISVVELCDLPAHACGGAQVLIWFRGQHGSATASPIVDSLSKRVTVGFHQQFILGPLSDALMSYLRDEVLNFRVSCMI